MHWIVKHFFNAILVGTSIFLVFLLFYFFQGKTIVLDKGFYTEYLENLVFSIIIYMANMFVFKYYYDKNEGRLYKLNHLVPAIGAGILVTIAAIFFSRILLMVVWDGVSFDQFIADERPGYYITSLIISLVVMAIVYSVFYYKHKKERQVKEQKIIAGTASAQFDALKNQLDPHFLFNSLNVLTSLIEENPDQAQKFTTSLSKVYRYVLEQKNKELVTLQEELTFAKTYMNLIKMRYEDSVVFSLPDQVENPDFKVVPLSLQLLLENAVKHNRVTPHNKLQISIYEDQDNLVVKNNLQEKQVLKKSSGVGLKNIKQRYELLTSKEVFIQKSTSHFTVKLPLLSKQISTMRTTKTYLDEKRYTMAKNHVEQLKGFYVNFTMYLIGVPCFIVFNALTTDFPWAIFPIAGWGLGVFFHAAEVFNWNPFLGKSWEERKIKELMEKDKR